MRLDVTFSCEMVWMSDKTLLAKDERLEKNDIANSSFWLKSFQSVTMQKILHDQ